MVDSTTKQLSLFGNNPQFDDNIRRVEIKGIVHFSVLDVFQYYGRAKNPTTSWETALKRLDKQGFERSREILEWRFDAVSGGKPTPICSYKTMLRIAQVTEFKEWEHIRQWMAEVANERIEEMLNPGLGTQRAKERDLKLLKAQGYSNKQALDRLEIRIDTMSGFKSLMEKIKEVCINPNYGKITNAEYMALFGEVASGLEAILNTKSVRDALPTLQLSYLKTAELTLREAISASNELTMAQLLSLVNDYVLPLGEHLKTVSEKLGRHHITGKRLLGRGDVD